MGFVSDGKPIASLWSGSASSRVDLHPEDPFYQGSCAWDISDGQAVGYVKHLYPDSDPLTYTTSAMLWTGSSEVYLAGGDGDAYGVGDGQQVGYVLTSDSAYLHLRAHARLWSGSLESGVDLHPKKAVESCAYDISGGQQVGYATFSNKERVSFRYSHAGVWFGKAASWMDLHPAGYGRSEARGASRGYQAGSAWSGDWVTDEWGTYWVGNQHAGMWSGTAESWADLHTLLPQDYAESGAEDIEVTDTDVWGVGWASQDITGPAQAIVRHKSLSQ